MIAASGEQVELSAGGWSAVVVEVGGGLRALECDAVPVIEAYPPEEIAVGGHGQPLLPWPNRLAQGRYRWAGQALRLPIDDPDARAAIHGLTRWANWRIGERSAAACAMELRLHPRPGYPFTLDLRLDYALSSTGLTVDLSARNAGEAPAPFGAGFHLYLAPGAPRVDAVRLTLPAASWLPADARGVPTGERRPVAGALDFRAGRQVGSARLDHCFTELARDAGLARVSLAGPGGRVTTLTMDGLWSHVMVFTGDTLAPDRRRTALAVEPMTCAPDAFNSGDGLLTILPGEAVTGRWSIGVE